ncbi:MAG: hypothetical protein QF903_07945 [Planctomycetota bacterium]|jgi:hypothetical protein|nr:hypothetical protein [Planctomycetota bacterium]MDP6989397.1 hypothetical protein [Planctomycetota bacterium]
MNAINGAVNVLFDLALKPLELLGREFALLVVSGVFGIGALVAFKHISWQRGIRQTKDKIKGHMIAIRIYQDDLVVVMRSTANVLTRILQYLGLNFGPFVPLALPFVFVVAQMVTRYGFEPLAVHEPSRVAQMLPGQGTLVRIEFAPEHAARAGELELMLPTGVEALSPLARIPSRGLAFQEIAATEAGLHELELRLADGTSESKLLAAGDVDAPLLQPERVRSIWLSFMWPAEDRFPPDSPFSRVSFHYPDGELAWLPDGAGGIVITFILASMVFGFAMLKPLGVEI